MALNFKSKFFRRLTRMGWILWLFPISAIVICCWLSYHYIINRGPLITISFNDAAAIEVNKTPLRYRGVTVGKVQSLQLSEDTEQVIVKARLSREAKPLAVEGTRFWIVQPQVGFQGVSGLETILKGPYIQLEPGDGKIKTSFEGYMGDDISDNAPGTVKYFLKASEVDSVNVGDSVSFRGLKIGAVSGVRLGDKAQVLIVQVNIDVKYVRLIRTNTTFWRRKGLQADLGLFGAKIEVNSLESLMRGGIAIVTPPEPGKIANAESTFELVDAPPKDWEKWMPAL